MRRRYGHESNYIEKLKQEYWETKVKSAKYEAEYWMLRRDNEAILIRESQAADILRLKEGKNALQNRRTY